MIDNKLHAFLHTDIDEIDMKTTRKISSEQQFNASQPCASDMHNGCDKCEPKYGFVEVHAKLVRGLIKEFDNHDITVMSMELIGFVDKLEALLKEQGK